MISLGLLIAVHKVSVFPSCRCYPEKALFLPGRTLGEAKAAKG